MIRKKVHVPIPNGPITLVFRNWESGKSKQGNPQLILTFTPEIGEPVIKDYFPYETQLGWAKLEAFLSAIGVELDPDAEEFDEEAIFKDLLGLEVPAVVINELFQGVFRLKISYYGGPQEVTAPAPTLNQLAQLSPILSKEDREKRRQALQIRLAGEPSDWDTQRASHQAEAQEELESPRNGEAPTSSLARRLKEAGKI